jgi:alpha-L-fucosidase
MKRIITTIISIVFIINCYSQLSQNKYEATLSSIKNHEVPEWFEDAKFGMFIDWGIFSVPGYAEPRPTGKEAI